MGRKVDSDCQARSENSSITPSGDPPPQADIALLDRYYFMLPKEAFKRFHAMLDQPPESNPRLERLLKSKVWF